MPSRRVQPGTFKFVLIAIAIMVVSEFVFYRDKPAEAPDANSVVVPQDITTLSPRRELHTQPKLEINPQRQYLDHYPSARLRAFLAEPIPSNVDDVHKSEVMDELEDVPLWKKNSVAVDVPEGWSSIAIVIDDLGVSRKNSEAIIALDAPMTMAFLPYADRLKTLVQKAREKGHEIIIHMPMEPMNADLDTGDIALTTDQDAESFMAMLDKAFGAIHGYVGINNHMGSRLTQDEDSMALLMPALKSRGLLFLDSRTIHSSVAAKTAKSMHVPYAVRDVFLDHDPSIEGVMKSLEKTERMARKHGHAVAIGHPKAVTIQALKDWIPTLEDKKIKLVPISYSVERQMLLNQSEPDVPLQ